MRFYLEIAVKNSEFHFNVDFIDMLDIYIAVLYLDLPSLVVGSHVKSAKKSS
jgi:hypothetical protein